MGLITVRSAPTVNHLEPKLQLCVHHKGFKEVSGCQG